MSIKVSNFSNSVGWSAALFLLTAFVVVGGLSVDREWALTHWLFSYELEFLKRALVGELWRQLSWPTGLPDLQLAAGIVLAALVALLLVLFMAPAWSSPGSGQGLWRFAVLAMCCPATVAHMAYDFGRFDQLNFLLALAAIGVVAWRNSVFTGTVLLVLMSISILIHEAALFMFVPVVLAFWYWRYPTRTQLMVVAFVLLLLLMLTAFVWQHGHMSDMDMPSYMALLAQRHGTWVMADSVSVLFRDSVEANVQFTVQRAFSTRYLRDHVWMFLFVLMPLIFLLRPVFLTAVRHLPRSAIVLLSAALVGPLMLMPIGHDYFRWWSIGVTNALLVITLFACRYDQVAQALSTVMDRRRRWVMGVVLLFLFVGPLGVTKAFERPIYKNGWTQWIA